jgi:hypothetical protein
MVGCNIDEGLASYCSFRGKFDCADKAEDADADNLERNKGSRGFLYLEKRHKTATVAS